ncbi:MAG: hypothetical protein AAGC57_12685, partial [Pseudomonadota bacterium]
GHPAKTASTTKTPTTSKDANRARIHDKYLIVLGHLTEERWTTSVGVFEEWERHLGMFKTTNIVTQDNDQRGVNA